MTEKSNCSIDICGVPFKICERAVVNKDDTNYGQIVPIEGKIYMNGLMTPEIYDVTLIHEWLHGVLGSNNVDHNETQVSVLSVELYRKGFRVPIIRNETQQMPPKASPSKRQVKHG